MSDSLGICRIFSENLPSFGGIFAPIFKKLAGGAGRTQVGYWFASGSCRATRYCLSSYGCRAIQGSGLSFERFSCLNGCLNSKTALGLQPQAKLGEVKSNSLCNVRCLGGTDCQQAAQYLLPPDCRPNEREIPMSDLHQPEC